MIVNQTGLTTGELTSLLSYVMNILMSLMMLSMVFVMVTQSAAAAQRIEEVLEEQPDITSPENAVKNVRDGSVDFEHVTFAYQQRSGQAGSERYQSAYQVRRNHRHYGRHGLLQDQLGQPDFPSV